MFLKSPTTQGLILSVFKLRVAVDFTNIKLNDTKNLDEKKGEKKKMERLNKIH